MKNIWNWFNGKKTIIGLALIALAGQDFFLNLVNNPDIVSAFNWIGSILAGTGLVHKASKKIKIPKD